jgi:hypothetical protein
MSFEENRGQTGARVRFLARGHGYTLFLTDDEAAFSLIDAERVGAAMRMSLVGARSPRRVHGLDPLPGQSHYLRGSDSRRWTTGVRTYAKVRHQEVYRGIDLVYYGNQGQLEYDFLLKPGADPSRIRVRLAGVDRLRVAENGDLLMRLGDGELRQRRPVAFQNVSGVRREVSAAYVLEPEGIVGFRIGAYDTGLPLTIDPVLLYSTYLGGRGEVFGASEMAVDPSGAVYLAGTTTSVDFPTTSGALRPDQGGGDYDAFITKYDEEGRVVYSTYFGGHDTNDIGAIAVDRFGAVYVAGLTNAVDFPITPGAFQATCTRFPPTTTRSHQCNAGFVSKLDPSGSTFLFSTYFGSGVPYSAELPAYSSDITVDADLNVIMAGYAGRLLPVTAGVFQPVHRGASWTGFVAKLNAAGSALHYASYLGGDHFDFIYGVATDGEGNVYVTGESRSSDFPTTEGAFQRTCEEIDVPTSRGCSIAFVTKVNSTATALVYSTLLGGRETTGPAVNGLSSEARDIAVDQHGFAYVTGKSLTLDFPTTPGSFKPTSQTWDAFVTKVNLDGTGLVYSTLVGGDVVGPASVQHEIGTAIRVDADGSVDIAGMTSATDFPLVNPVQATFGGSSWDVFVARLNPSGSALTFSTFLGGSGDDDAVALARDQHQNLIVGGTTRSPDFPMVNPAQGTFPGEKASFVAKIGEPICGTEVTGQAQVFQSAIVPFFPPFNLQLVIVWNSSPSPVAGPVAYVMDDLQNAAFIGPLYTRCLSPEGDQLTLVPLGGDNVLAPNEAALLGLWFYQTQPAPISYTPRLLSGNRNY